MIVGFWLFIIFTFISTVSSAQNSWPKEIAPGSGCKLVNYDLSGDKLIGRSTVSAKQTTKGEPIFGAIFYEAELKTNNDSRMADIVSFKISNAKFSGVEDKAKVEKLSKQIEMALTR
jgi:hypothetical protein